MPAHDNKIRRLADLLQDPRETLDVEWKSWNKSTGGSTYLLDVGRILRKHYLLITLHGCNTVTMP